jgi:uncharacterized protein (DUF1684 family)
MKVTMSLSLLGWRRRVAQIYADVRAASDPEAAHVTWRAAREDLLRWHPDSPIPAGRGERYVGYYAPYDPTLRFELEVDTDAEPARFEVATGTDGVVPFVRVGVVHLPELGDLDVWWLASYGGGVFLPVKDATARRETYGGGRYLLDTVKGADLGGSDGRLVVDLNFAYNPSCAYDPAWACPLAPPGNVLVHPIRAGELLPQV